MAQKPLSDADHKWAYDLLKAHGGNAVDAALAVKMNPHTFSSRVRNMRIWAKTQGLPDIEPASAPQRRDFVVPEPREPLALSFEEAWVQWTKAIGMAKDRFKARKQERKANKPQKILVIPDLHVPFHEPEFFATMLTEDGDADKAICIGDFGDAYALSRFVRYERMPYRDEWAAVTLAMQELASTFPEIDVIIGNHDARLEKALRTHLTEDMVDAIQCMTGGVLCPITALAKRYPNVRIVKNEAQNGMAMDWWTSCGDAWLGHPEKFSRVPSSAVRFTEEWLHDFDQTLGMQIENYRLIVMGHTHAYSQFPWRSGRLLVECGCLCKTQGYMLSPRIGGRPQRRGYLTFEQTDGRTDLNSVRFRWFDVEDRDVA